jgi:hypothetical protein
MEALPYRELESTGNSRLFVSLLFNTTYSLEEASYAITIL